MPGRNRTSVIVGEDQRLVVLLGELPEAAVYVVGIAAFGFQLNGHVWRSMAISHIHL